MGKRTDDSVMDAALDKIATCTAMHVCTSEPLTLAEATTTYNLATQVMVGGDYTKANGDVSGRKVTVAAKAGLSITSTGTALHLALTDGVSVLEVTTVTSQLLTSGGTVDVPAWDHEIADSV
jgi:hypothetical protein